MVEVEKEAERRHISIEELVAETEKRITDSTYDHKITKDTSINYHGTTLEFRMEVITQERFEDTNKLIKEANAVANRRLLEQYLINKETNEPFTREQIKKLFTAGLASALVIKIMDESDFNLDELKQRQVQIRNFP